MGREKATAKQPLSTDGFIFKRRKKDEKTGHLSLYVDLAEKPGENERRADDLALLDVAQDVGQVRVAVDGELARALGENLHVRVRPLSFTLRAAKLASVLREFQLKGETKNEDQEVSERQNLTLK